MQWFKMLKSPQLFIVTSSLCLAPQLQKKIGGPVEIFQHKRVASTQCIFVDGLNWDPGLVLSPAKLHCGWVHGWVADHSENYQKENCKSDTA